LLGPVCPWRSAWRARRPDAAGVEAQFDEGGAHRLATRLGEFDEGVVVDFRLLGQPLQQFGMEGEAGPVSRS